MAVKKEFFSIKDKIKFESLSKTDQEEVLASGTLEEAIKKLYSKKASKSIGRIVYDPVLQPSGSSVQYKTKNLFTDTFDEQDVRHFTNLAEMTAGMDDELVAGELKKKISAMLREGKGPLQCMVYATKQNETEFYGNEKNISVWAKVIAETADSDDKSLQSVNHMLVNWGMWKRQILMLVMACGFIKRNEKLNSVIRDMYLNYEDDKVRYIILKRLLNGRSSEDYKAAFAMLKKVDFVNNERGREFFDLLMYKVKHTDDEDKKALETAFRKVKGFSGSQLRRIENLFGTAKELEFVKKVNESAPEQKEEILKEIKVKVYGKQKDYRELATRAGKIQKYRKEIQDMFIDKLSKTNLNLEDIKFYGFAIRDLDDDGRALPIFKDRLADCRESDKKIMFAYNLAVFSDEYMGDFLDAVLGYDGLNGTSFLKLVTMKHVKNPVIKEHLYSGFMKIINSFGIQSHEVEIAIRNMGEYFQGGNRSLIYDARFDQILFAFLGYNEDERSFDEARCTERNATLVLCILEKVMDEYNYKERYSSFIEVLKDYVKEKHYIDLADRIDRDIISLPDDGGLPTAGDEKSIWQG